MSDRSNRKAPDTPVAVERLWNLWVWLDARVAGFPVASRHSVGEPLCRTALTTLEALLEATYLPSGDPGRVAALRTGNTRLALLRLLVRGAHARRLLSHDQHAYAMTELVEVGRLVGGWLKAATAGR